MSAKFPLGNVVATPGALKALTRLAGENWRDLAREYLDRHQSGDRGDLCEEDKQQNELSVKEGFRIFSAYHLKDQTKIWIITEPDRSATTIRLPEDY